MSASLDNAFGYQDDALNLPVADLGAALPFYENIFGFRVVSRGDTPHKSAVLARDHVQIGLVENRGDATQDGCAFHVTDLDALRQEFNRKGLQIKPEDVGVEDQGDGQFNVFYAIAPDGLCYWFGEKRP